MAKRSRSTVPFSGEIANADPLIDSPAPQMSSPGAPMMDYPAHTATYNQFLKLVKWFCIHLVFLMPALYCFIIAGSSALGFVLLFIAIGTLIYGVVHNPKVERDVSQTLASGTR